jgi:hypothetical protein
MDYLKKQGLENISLGHTFAERGDSL